jgi:parallel beta-helix repeat protein
LTLSLPIPAPWSLLDGALVLDGVADVSLDLSVDAGPFIPRRVVGGFGYTAVILMNCRNVGLRLHYRGNGLKANGLGLDNCEGCSVMGGTFTGMGEATAAILSIGGRDNRYEGNFIGPTPGQCRGLWIGGTNAGEAETRATIVHNSIDRTAGTGIVFVGAKTLIERNSVHGTGGAGIKAGVGSSDIAVINNVATRNAFHGFQDDAMDPTNPCRQIVLRGNTFCDNRNSGIYLTHTLNGEVAGNDCEGNAYGIYVGPDAKNVTVGENRTAGNARGGVRDDRPR